MLELAVNFGHRSLKRLTELNLNHQESAEELLWKRSEFTGLVPSGSVSAGGSCRLLPTIDGWCAVNLPREDDLELLPAWLGVEAQEEVPWESISDQLRTRPTDIVVRSGQELGLAISALPSGEEDEQLQFRGTANAARPWIVRRVGEQTGAKNVEDLRVVDLSSLWAGPLCARFLTVAGAHVTKIESISRPDGARCGNAEFFSWLHGGQSLKSVPFATADGVGHLKEIIANADVVIEGSRPRALDRLGIIPAEVVSNRPGMVWVSITAYGRCGPWCNWVGFGDDAAVAGGLVEQNVSGPSFVSDAIADPLTGMVAAALVAGAVAAGGGVTIDLALREVARSAARGAVVVW